MPFYILSLFILVLLSAVAQQFMPVIDGLYDARLLVFPLVFLCAAVTLNPAGMLFFAFLCGFMWDAQHVHMPVVENAVYNAPVETLPFGYSIILYAAMGMLMLLVQPLFRSGKWHYSIVVAGLSIFAYLWLEYLLINFLRGGLVINQPTLLKIAWTAGLTMLVSPLVYWILFRLAELFHYEITYEGLNRSRRYNLD